MDDDQRNAVWKEDSTLDPSPSRRRSGLLVLAGATLGAVVLSTPAFLLALSGHEDASGWEGAGRLALLCGVGDSPPIPDGVMRALRRPSQIVRVGWPGGLIGERLQLPAVETASGKSLGSVDRRRNLGQPRQAADSPRVVYPAVSLEQIAV